MLGSVLGGAQLPCEAFVLAIVADDLIDDGSDTPSWRTHLLLVSDGFIVRARCDVAENEARALGRSVLELSTGARNEISFRMESGQLYLSLARQPRGEVSVAGHLVRDATGLYSAFQSRTDLGSVETFGDALRVFPYA